MRIIARLDIKGPNLIKGIQLEGLRIIGNPNFYAKKYYQEKVDELLLIDCVASLYGRNHLTEIIEKATKDVFIPITVGGGIRSVNDVEKLLKSGADKVSINTAAVEKPELINELSREFGSQSVIASIEAKRKTDSTWEVYTNNGRERTGKDVLEWAKETIDRGAGEILITSVDKEGTQTGFDNDLINFILPTINIPCVISGGMSKLEDLNIFSNYSICNGVAVASVLHYEKYLPGQIKEYVSKNFNI